MEYHKLLQKQIKKLLIDKGIESLPKEFLDSINDSYLSFERDKQLSEHAFDISEKEYIEVNEKLASETEVRGKLIRKIIDAIKLIDDRFVLDDINNVNVLETTSYLNKLIEITKKAEREILAAKNEADKANNAKSDFLSMISHEIRTPLNAVIGMVFLLQSDDPKPEQLNHLSILKSSADNLLLLINDILDLSKIEAGKIELEPTTLNLEALLTNLINTHKIKARDNNVEIISSFDSSINCDLIGDSLRLTQVFNNLISNAVKFTKNGTITVGTELIKDNLDELTVKCFVKDTGIGIHEENIKSIFKSFTQESSSTYRKFGGTGLGLSITKKLLTLMCSEIKVTSVLGEGSTFYFKITLPKHDVDAFEKNTNPISLEGVSILIVDDTPNNLPFLIKLLESHKAKVDTAISGFEAIQKVKNSNYHIILMDILMPDMDGYETTKEILELNPLQKIIAFSASANNEMELKTKQVGMIGCISKPFNPNQLIKLITNSL